jgi:peptidoglycan-N-acetylglucosamine deacetylase
MLNFRNTNIFFIILLFVLIGIHIKYGLPVYIYILLLVAYSLIIFYGCINVGSGFFIKIICSAHTDQKEIAISFDDGPAANHTIEILQLLQKENIKATFFCIGNRIPGNENILEQVRAGGHIIGNHSYSHHFWFDLFSSKKMLNDLKQMDQELERVIGLKPKLFRPPYGVTNPNLKKAIINGGYTPVGWSVRSMDTVIKDEKKLLGKVNSAIKPGAVFLFHDTCKITLNILPSFIEQVKKKGYQVVSLDKLLHLKPYA